MLRLLFVQAYYNSYDSNNTDYYRSFIFFFVEGLVVLSCLLSFILDFGRRCLKAREIII